MVLVGEPWARVVGALLCVSGCGGSYHVSVGEYERRGSAQDGAPVVHANLAEDASRMTLTRINEWAKSLPGGSKSTVVDSKGPWTLACASRPGLHDGSDALDASSKCLLATPAGSIELESAVSLSETADVDRDGRPDVIVGLVSEHTDWAGFAVYAERPSGPVELALEDGAMLSVGRSQAGWEAHQGGTAVRVDWMLTPTPTMPGEEEPPPAASRSTLLVWDGRSLVAAGP